jgi:hypothetical protein
MSTATSNPPLKEKEIIDRCCLTVTQTQTPTEQTPTESTEARKRPLGAKEEPTYGDIFQQL